MSLVLIEGCDKCGKSTLARELYGRYGVPIVKFSQPKGDPFVEYMEFLQKHGQKRRGHAILDRFYLGELVYGPIKRGGSAISEEQARAIEDYLKTLNAVGIWASNTEENVVSNFRKDGESFLLESEAKAVLSGYEREVAKSSLTWLPYSYDAPETKKLIFEVLDGMLGRTL